VLAAVSDGKNITNETIYPKFVNVVTLTTIITTCPLFCNGYEMDGKCTAIVEVEKCLRKNESYETNEEIRCMREVTVV
jgi:hypothetical protein